jgi:hypothetical protein
MQPKLRTTIAYIAGRIITGLDTSSIYDHLQSKSVSFEGTITPSFVNIFNNERGVILPDPGKRTSSIYTISAICISSICK